MIASDFLAIALGYLASSWLLFGSASIEGEALAWRVPYIFTLSIATVTFVALFVIPESANVAEQDALG